MSQPNKFPAKIERVKVLSDHKVPAGQNPCADEYGYISLKDKIFYGLVSGETVLVFYDTPSHLYTKVVNQPGFEPSWEFC